MSVNGIHSILTGNGRIGFGRASGENHVSKATKVAINSPLLDGISLENAQKLFVNITTSTPTVMNLINTSKAEDIINLKNSNIFSSITTDKTMGDDFMVTIVATSPFDDTPQLFTIEPTSPQENPT